MAEKGLEPGTVYRVMYRLSANDPVQTIVASFIDAANYAFFFSGRPTYGTVKIDTRTARILSITEVPTDTPRQRPQNEIYS